MPYRERRSPQHGITVWTRTADDRPGSILPDGCIDVIWDGAGLTVAGPDTAAHVADSRPGARYAAVRFDSGIAPTVLGVPAHALVDMRVALDDVLPADQVASLAEALDAASEPSAVIERWATARLTDRGGADPDIGYVVRMLDKGAGVTETADSLGVSERQLHRRSLVAFGYGPKLLARILRLQRALRSPYRATDLARVAADAGYADQPHLSREVRALTGKTPSELFYNGE
jgi:AraC-like DNA-binding protein